MDLDRFNPIFVLHCRKTLNFLRKYSILLVAIYVIIALPMWFAVDRTLLFYETSQMLGIVALGLLMLLGFFVSLNSVHKMAQRTIDQDLIHFTAMTDRKIINGYLMVGAFHNLMACGCVFVILTLLFIKEPIYLPRYLIGIGSIFLATEALVVFMTPLYAIARKPYQLVCAQLSLFFMLFVAPIMLLMFAGLMMSTHFNSFISFIGVVLLITAPAFGYEVAWRCRKWKASFSQKIVLLAVLYLDYFIVFVAIFALLSLGHARL